MYGKKVVALFKEVKKIFDPQNIFNPHKKTDATLSYLKAHIKTDNDHSVWFDEFPLLQLAKESARLIK